MKFIKTLLASVAFVAMTSSANAADVIADLGPITDTVDHIENVLVPKNTSFEHIYTFSLDANALDFSASKIVLTQKGVDRFNFSDLNFSIFSGEYDVAVDLSTLTALHTVSVLAGEQEFSLAGLNSGSYFLLVDGVTSGASGGAYSFSITPVPEPSSVAMLLVGFAALGAVARRRSKSL